MRSSFLLCLGMGLLLFACNTGSSPGKDDKDTSTPVRTTTTIKAEKPTFPGYPARSYILGQDTTFMRVIVNSPYKEKVWMVYFDVKDDHWRTIAWEGYGQNNAIIGDTAFARTNGLSGGMSSEDAPEFYAAWSEDSGRTWKPHHLEEAGYFCKTLHQSNVILISEPFAKNDYRPYIGLLVQWRHQQRSYTSNQAIANMNFDYYCDVTRNVR